MRQKKSSIRFLCCLKVTIPSFDALANVATCPEDGRELIVYVRVSNRIVKIGPEVMTTSMIMTLIFIIYVKIIVIMIIMLKINMTITIS